MAINHEDLLHRYLRHVIGVEGCDFLDALSEHEPGVFGPDAFAGSAPDLTFTTAEMAEMKRLAKPPFTM